MKGLIEKFENFVCFSFPSIETYLNGDGIEKKKLIFNGVEWKHITSSTFHWAHNSIAVICGQLSGITVIDIDSIEEYNKLVAKYTILSNVFRVKT